MVSCFQRCYVGWTSYLLVVCVYVLITLPSIAQSSITPPDSNTGRYVYDAKGNFVGALISNGTVAHKINGSWVSFPIGYNGIKSEGVNLYFTTRDCKGTAYISANNLPLSGKVFFPFDEGNFLFDGVFSDSGMLVFAMPPFSTIRVMSILAVQSINPLQGSCSEPDTKMNAFIGAAGTIKLGPYKTPFHIK